MNARLVVVAVCAALAACGGGDGGSSGDVAATPLSEANYVAVAKEGIAPAVFLMNAKGFILGAKASDPNAIVRFARAQLPKLAGWVSSAPAVVTGVTQTITEACSGGGYISVVANDANNSGAADAGDSFSITAYGCSFEGVLIDGNLGFVVNSLTGTLDFPPYSVSMTISLNDLKLTSGEMSETARGSYTLAATVLGPDTGVSSMDVPSLSIWGTYAGESFSRTLTNYAISSSETLGATTLEADGILSTSVLQANPLATQTVIPFTSGSAEDYPSVGRMVLSAALGGKVRLTALSAASALVELDANGDGAYEVSSTVPWSDLI